MRQSDFQALVVLVASLPHGLTTCVERSCQDSLTPGFALICGSGRWQSVPVGTFKCLNSQLVYSSSITSEATGQTSNISSASVTTTIQTTTTIFRAKTSQPASLLYSSAPSSLPYHSYHGDGSTQDGWPSIREWISFEDMFSINMEAIEQSCQQWGVPLNTDQETQDLKSAIESTSRRSGLDERFVLAIVMQESQGCVRVVTTFGSHPNPGLMQSYNGSGNCNANNSSTKDPQLVRTPCPSSEIQQMIRDGTNGTASNGLGLVQYMQLQGHTDTSRWYRAARGYNGGTSSITSRLEDGCCTKSYSSDIANRLIGWTGPRSFQQ